MTKLLVTRKNELKVLGHKVVLRRLVSKDKKVCAVSLTINGYEFRSPDEAYYQEDLKDLVCSIRDHAQRAHMLIFMDMDTEITYRARLHEDGSVEVASAYGPKANSEVLNVTTVAQLHEVSKKFHLAL